MGQTVSNTQNEDMDVERLIELVKGKPVLYDPNHKDYQRYEQKCKVWETIAQKMDSGVDDVKAKWATVRKGYAKYKRAVKNTKPHSQRISEYRWSSHLSFLDKYVYDERTAQCLNVYNPPPSPSPPLADAEPLSELPQSHLAAQQTESRKRSAGDVAHAMQQYKKRKEGNDVVDHLFLSYAETFKQFPPREQAILKVEIAKIFASTELRLLGIGDLLQIKHEELTL